MLVLASVCQSASTKGVKCNQFSTALIKSFKKGKISDTNEVINVEGNEIELPSSNEWKSFLKNSIKDYIQADKSLKTTKISHIKEEQIDDMFNPEFKSEDSPIKKIKGYFKERDQNSIYYVPFMDPYSSYYIIHTDKNRDKYTKKFDPCDLSSNNYDPTGNICNLYKENKNIESLFNKFTESNLDFIDGIEHYDEDLDGEDDFLTGVCCLILLKTKSNQPIKDESLPGMRKFINKTVTSITPFVARQMGHYVLLPVFNSGEK